MGRRVLGLIGVCVLVLWCVAVSAEIPQVISYQGKVTDASGNPVADGSYTMRFRIYDALTVGTLLWDSGARTVPVAGGVFSVLLGESPQPALTLDFNVDYWLLVTFSGVDQSPRQRMASTGYAYMASGLVPGTEVSGSVTSGPYATIKGTNTATTGETSGVMGHSASPSGAGVYGGSTAVAGTGSGVYGQAASTAGSGVVGWATANSGANMGVYGVSVSSSGTGVKGLASATSGPANGVHGTTYSTYGIGVNGVAMATSGGTLGVAGASASPNGIGTMGIAQAGWGPAYGVAGWSESTEGIGVYGCAEANVGSTFGVYGWSTSADGMGVKGNAPCYGVYGQATDYSANSFGVYGYAGNSPSGRGVYGAGGHCGLEGYSSGGDGLRSFSDATNKSGVYGLNTLSEGTVFGVYGRTYSASGYGVYSSGDFAASGAKSGVVRTSQGPTLMYCQESPENWFEDFGEGTLVSGRCHIELDPLFLETVTIDETHPMLVFVQPFDQTCSGAVVKRGVTGFDVVSPLGNTATGEFGYRVVAKRKGFEAKRLDYCKAGQRDSYLYPELREKELREYGAERARMEAQRQRMEAARAEREAFHQSAVGNGK